MIDVGAGLVIGTVGADGAPRAERAWAVSVVDPDTKRVRIVLGADDPVTVQNLANGPVALTGADVRTFDSVQFKGHVVAVEPPTSDDVAHVREHVDRFFAAVHATDGNPIELLRRMLPHEMVAVEMVVGELFDQTPGPDAGAALAPGGVA